MEKLLPQNIEAECGVLGSIIIDPEAIVQVADFLSAEDFYRDAHRTIYEIILQLYEEHEPADFITICDELERRNKLEDVGGAGYITSLINQVPTSGNVEYYGRIVERTAILRRLIHAAGQIAAIAYEEADAEVALDKAEQLIFAIGQRYSRSDFSHLRELLFQYMDKLEQLHKRRGMIVGVPTGFADLDRLTGGLQKSDLIVLASRPGIGKTSMALSLAHNAAVKYQNSIAIFSLEMSKEQLVQRLLSMDASVDQQRLRTGWIEDEDWERIVYAMGTLSEANIWIDDTASISPMEMRSKARRLQAQHGMDLIIVDYLQLMQSAVGGKRNENRVQEISEISRNLKGLARELNMPVLALAQLSRAVESRQSKVPQLSDLRESGCLAGETPVYLPDLGTYRPIEQLVGQRDLRVLALNTETWQLEPCRVSNAFATGHKPVYRLTTRLGRTIRATANHQFLTIDGWQRLDSLSVGEHIAVLNPEAFTAPGRPQGIEERRTGPIYRARGGGVVGKAGMNDNGPCTGNGSSSQASAIMNVDKVNRTHAVEFERTMLVDGMDQARPPRGRDKSGPYALAIAAIGLHACPAYFVKVDNQARTDGFISSSKNLPVKASAGAGTVTALYKPALEWRYRGDVYWDKIVAIELDGEAEVYDLTIDKYHNFIANDIILHNSIEQDSDIVMFIYRDDVYNPESERKNIADIIVAKHRNGPVGQVSLYFQANQTRFRDLELNPPAE